MATLITACRLALAMVFALAAAAKLVDRTGATAAAEDLGVPPALAGATGRLLPVAELTVVAAVATGPAAPAGAGLALFLLVLFTALIALNLAQGRRPACRCFGQLGDARVGGTSIARNGALMALATIVLVAAPARLPVLHRALAGESTRLGVSPWISLVALAGVTSVGLGMAVRRSGRRRLRPRRSLRLSPEWAYQANLRRWHRRETEPEGRDGRESTPGRG